MKRLFLVGIVLALVLFIASPLRADLSYDDLTKQIEDLNKTFSDISKANQTNEAQLNQLQKRLDDIKAQVAVLEQGITTKEEQIAEGEKAFEAQQKLLEARARSYYKNIGKNSFSIVNLLLSDNISTSLENFFYQKTIVDEDKKAIIRIAAYIKGVEDKKKELESEKASLATVKAEVDKQSQFMAGEVAKAKAYMGQLQSQIASLVAQQQQIIAQRLAGLNISRSANTAGRCDSDLTNGRDPGFSPRFALFTYGVPNRVGMNQYGAWGRAKAGQNETAILQAYYNYDEIKKWDTGVQIRVDGLGTYSLEDYVKRIYEIPDSWADNNMAALKAQAIAARSFVLAYTNNGSGSICATESCQVVKSDPKGGNWEQAVNQTEGQVMVKGGNPIKAWFSSTHGGYIFSSGEIGWSGTDWTKHGNDFDGSVGSFDDLKNKAYDKDSPWFYCDWGSRSDYNKTAWLKSDEMADIVNVAMLALKDGSTIGNLYQPDKSNPAGKDTWDANKVKDELKSRGLSPFSSINSISVSADFGYGRSTSVTASGDGGSQSFSASDFKTYFNQRAPANIQIVGPLFNVEKR